VRQVRVPDGPEGHVAGEMGGVGPGRGQLAALLIDADQQPPPGGLLQSCRQAPGLLRVLDVDRAVEGHAGHARVGHQCRDRRFHGGPFERDQGAGPA
jgi:hypothetical protein